MGGVLMAEPPDIRTLLDSFGYVPDRKYEQFTIYQPAAQAPMLVVIHPRRKPRVYKLDKTCVEIDLDKI